MLLNTNLVAVGPRNLLKNPNVERNRRENSTSLDRYSSVLLKTDSADIGRLGPAEHFSESS
jgi:hypothetical protein